nr:MAG TPA: hypothetical protein [Bacteriophage sp.]
MKFEMPKSRVYILLDEKERIVRVEGEYSLPSDLTGWVQIDEGYGDRFSLAQSHYLDGGLYTMQGIPRYKYADGACVLRSEAEIAEDVAALPKPQPSQLDRVEAQATYTAMMTDTMMEG